MPQPLKALTLLEPVEAESVGAWGGRSSGRMTMSIVP